MALITGRGNGLFGRGITRFIEDDLELGERVAIGMDDEQIWGARVMLWFLTLPRGEITIVGEWA